jgi:uncharacterized protein (TIGR03435 family)
MLQAVLADRLKLAVRHRPEKLQCTRWSSPRTVPNSPLQFHLSRQLGRTILDETGLAGTYDFTLKFPDGARPGIDNPTPPASAEPALSAAIEQQLGLKLEARTAAMEVLVIEHIERPLQD